jgi:hypothetical protein
MILGPFLSRVKLRDGCPEFRADRRQSGHCPVFSGNIGSVVNRPKRASATAARDIGCEHERQASNPKLRDGTYLLATKNNKGNRNPSENMIPNVLLIQAESLRKEAPLSPKQG